MKITVGKSKRIMASESDGNYDKSFKAKGTTYYIEMLSGAGNYVAKWWDSSDNGLGYNNKGWVAIEGKNYRALNNISDVSSDNVMDLLGVISDYGRKPGKPIQDRIKREVAKLIDFDAINSACGKKSVKAASSGKIPYDLVSSLVILRDWGDVEDAYINDEHKALVDIADTLYNAGISPDEMSKKYKAVYDKYGKKFFDMVIDDASAIDSQISSHNVNDLVDEYNEKSEAFEHGVKASRRSVCASSFRTDFQKFLGDIDREVSDALYQYDDAMWEVKGTMSPGDDGSYWFELNLWCDGEEAGTVNIEYNGDTFLTNTDAYVVSVSDSDEIQAEGNSFADVYDTCVGELIRLAEDYVNFVRFPER